MSAPNKTIKQYVNTDFNQNQLIHPVIDNDANKADNTGIAGQMYFDTGNGSLYFHDGNGWQQIGTSSGGEVNVIEHVDYWNLPADPGMSSGSWQHIPTLNKNASLWFENGSATLASWSVVTKEGRSALSIQWDLRYNSTHFTTANDELTLNEVPWSLVTGKPTIPTVTWRPIKMNGTQILANNVSTALDLVAGGGITLTNSNGAVTIASTVANPMNFKGTVNGSYPLNPVVGDTYKAIGDSDGVTPTYKIGDTVIYSSSGWVVIPSGDEPSGTVTSVAMTVPTGLSVSGSPITSSGTLAVTLASGYEIPTTAHVKNFGKITAGSNSSSTGAGTANTSSCSADAYNDTLTISPGNKWITTGTSDTSNNDTLYINHALSGITAGEYNHINVDAAGHIISGYNLDVPVICTYINSAAIAPVNGVATIEFGLHTFDAQMPDYNGSTSSLTPYYNNAVFNVYEKRVENTKTYWDKIECAIEVYDTSPDSATASFYFNTTTNITAGSIKIVVNAPLTQNYV